MQRWTRAFVPAIAILGFGLFSADTIQSKPGNDEGTVTASEVRCEPSRVGVGQPVHCQYEIGGVSSEPTMTVRALRGDAQEVYLTSSVACDPAGNCLYWRSGEFAVTYDKPGRKWVIVRACMAGSCVVAWESLRVVG